MILFVVVFTAILIWKEVPSFKREKNWKDLTVFSTVLLIGIILGLILALDIPFPNPIRGLETVFKPMTEFIIGKKRS